VMGDLGSTRRSVRAAGSHCLLARLPPRPGAGEGQKVGFMDATMLYAMTRLTSRGRAASLEQQSALAQERVGRA